jgi:hypothetical protein
MTAKNFERPRRGHPFEVDIRLQAKLRLALRRIPNFPIYRPMFEFGGLRVCAHFDSWDFTETPANRGEGLYLDDRVNLRHPDWLPESAPLADLCLLRHRLLTFGAKVLASRIGGMKS